MDWLQFSIMFFTFVPLFIWNRIQSTATLRHIETNLEVFRLETRTLIEVIQQDIKDFHKKLLEIKEKTKLKKETKLKEK